MNQWVQYCITSWTAGGVSFGEALMAVGDFRCLEPNAWFGLWRRFGGNLGPEPAKRAGMPRRCCGHRKWLSAAFHCISQEQETGLDQGFPHHLSGGKGPFKVPRSVARCTKQADHAKSGRTVSMIT